MRLIQVNVTLHRKTGKIEHNGIKIEFIGQIELYYDRGNHHEFLSLVNCDLSSGMNDHMHCQCSGQRIGEARGADSEHKF